MSAPCVCACQVSRLHGLLAPHLLQRLKRDVLRSLPPKREQIIRVELAPSQKQLYRTILTRSLPTLSGRESEPRLSHLFCRVTCCKVIGKAAGVLVVPNHRMLWLRTHLCSACAFVRESRL